MIILSHRGYWKQEKEKNQPIAFERSFALGFGTETDVRDIAGTLVIAHDMPCGDEMLFEELLHIMNYRNLPLAINIKADGLCDSLLALLHRYNHTNYFCFDMSIPDMVVQLRMNARVFTGISDILEKPVLLEQAHGIWLDSFYSDWYDTTLIDELISHGKQVCIVSAELHKRDSKKQWQMIKNSTYCQSSSLLLCTDYPEKAKEYFYV